MKISRRLAIGVGTVAVLAAGGTGVAVATGGTSGDSGEHDNAPVTAGAAAQAKAAALKATGGGTVTEVEGGDDSGAAYDVEVRTPDGRTLEVKLDKAFALVGTPTADDGDHSDHGDHQDRGDGDGEHADD